MYGEEMLGSYDGGGKVISGFVGRSCWSSGGVDVDGRRWAKVLNVLGRG